MTLSWNQLQSVELPALATAGNTLAGAASFMTGYTGGCQDFLTATTWPAQPVTAGGDYPALGSALSELLPMVGTLAEANIDYQAEEARFQTCIGSIASGRPCIVFAMMMLTTMYKKMNLSGQELHRSTSHPSFCEY